MNLRKFIKEGGFLILHNCMNLVFQELPEAPVGDQTHRGFAGLALMNKKEPFIPVELEDKVNFTINKTHSLYFRRNSKNVSLAILSLKIFDLIFTNMQFIDNSPQSSNRSYLL